MLIPYIYSLTETVESSTRDKTVNVGKNRGIKTIT